MIICGWHATFPFFMYPYFKLFLDEGSEIRLLFIDDKIAKVETCDRF